MNNHKSLDQQGGAMLLEGMIAILIFSLGILAIIGLQAASIRQTTDAKYRVDASFLASERVGLMWTNRAALANYAETDQPVASLPNGKRTVAVAGNQVTVTITWQVPGEAVVRRYSTITTING
jgi:type IV pilus assembly protein PilV